MSAKECSNDGHCEQRKRPHRRFLAAVLLFVVVVVLLLIIIWLVLRPSKPKFFLQDASVSRLNLTGGGGSAAASLLTTVVQVTLTSRNPNDRVGVYYDALSAYANYKQQRISAAAVLPAGYQGHNDVAVWSPFLYGAAVPLAPYLAASLSQDMAAGLVLFEVRVEGRLRWKVGTWVSGHYRLQVNCPAFITIDSGRGDGSSPAFHSQQQSSCTVDI